MGRERDVVRAGICLEGDYGIPDMQPQNMAPLAFEKQKEQEGLLVTQRRSPLRCSSSLPSCLKTTKKISSKKGLNTERASPQPRRHKVSLSLGVFTYKAVVPHKIYCKFSHMSPIDVSFVVGACMHYFFSFL